VLMCVIAFCLTHLPPTEIYTLSLHDALPISRRRPRELPGIGSRALPIFGSGVSPSTGRVIGMERTPFPYSGPLEADEVTGRDDRSEEHTSELQSRENLVCRLLLEKKNTKLNN